MKNVLFTVCISLVFASCASKTALSIAPGQRVEIDYPDYEGYSADLRNKSFTGLDVSVRSKENDEQIRGFGLGTVGKATVGVEAGSKLVIRNPGDRKAKVVIQVAENDPGPWAAPDNSISFTLANKSAESIPLIIPGVMNPNLSPMSNSGVSLAVGQQILFRYKGKNQVLLVVDRSIQEGAKIDVATLLKEKKAELNQ